MCVRTALNLLPLLVTVLMAFCWPTQATGAFKNVRIGQAFPEFSGKDNRDRDLNSSEFRDQLVVLAFVRGDQEFSIRVLRDLQALYSDLKLQGVEVLVIASDEGDRPWAELVKEHGLTIPLLFDDGEAVAEQTGLVVYPTTAILARNSILSATLLLHTFDYQQSILDEVESVLRLGSAGLSEEEIARRIHAEQFSAAGREAGMGNHARALELYASLLDDDPEPYRVHLAMGQLLLRMGQPAQAVAPLKEALGLRPRSTRSSHALGLAYARSGQDQLALPYLTEVLLTDPDPAPVHRELSRIHHAAGQLDQALEHARQALLAAERKSTW